MFDPAHVLWLQSWESPALTAVMNGISLLGYTAGYLTIATVFAFLLRARAALILFVLVTLSAAVTDIAKSMFEMPRPDRVDPRVEALSAYAPTDNPAVTWMFDDTYGFPSGHVCAAAASAVGLALVLGARGIGWTLAAIWVGLMALSRMYLGRHFAGDVLGGVLTGLAVAGVAFAILRVDRLARDVDGQRFPVLPILAVALILAGSALLVMLPEPAVAGRLLGVATGLSILASRGGLDDVPSEGAAVVRFIFAVAGFAAVAGLVTLVPVAAREAYPVVQLLATAAPLAALLGAPALLAGTRA